MSWNMTSKNNTRIFSQIFSSNTGFVTEWKSSGLYEEGLIKDESINTLYYLLYARYGNSPTASYDENNFKYQVWSLIYQHGPTWERKLEIQKTLRKLNEEEIMTGTKAINNIASNPASSPSTNNTEEIRTINGQTVAKYKKAKIEGYASLVILLDSDITKEFIDKFRPLFAMFTNTNPLLYVDKEGENDDDW